MYTIIIIAIIFTIVTYWLSYEELIGAFIGFLMGILVGFLVAWVIGVVAYDNSRIEVVKTTPLVSLADGSQINGRFSGGLFLSSGYINQKPSFTWYETSGDNTYVRKGAKASVSSVHYILDDAKPYYTISKEIDSDGDEFFKPWGINDDPRWPKKSYDFYVPKGSIVESYVLDNK